ncbi:Sec-independent protein translocase protein TatB [Bradyrhizobium sp. 2TAF24]|uniref:Sec-independent protein translocase protein TatB n=1 Tax=Bradyrhizobium sp. 2TAF24 TaxID=3233011 RepID=UPI003F91F689
MFDIGWGEMVVIGVVALVVIGPKELPGVLRTVGRVVGKARRMASEFQGQFNEALREAEMADLKKSFDDVSEAAKGFSARNILSSVTKDVEDALRVDPPATTPPATTPPATTPPATTPPATTPPPTPPATSEPTPPLIETTTHTPEIAPPVVPQDGPEAGKAP